MIVREISFQLARLFIIAWLLPGYGLKAQDLDSSEADFFEDSPLILTASRMSKPLMESPASVSVIDREMIESSGVREVADIFRLVPGFIVGNFNGYTPVVTYQGLGTEFSRQLQVLIDGRSVFIPSFGGVPWTNLPLLLEDIERVEIIRGPNAVTYGTNAFLATINIITRHSAEDLGHRYSLTTSDNSNPNVTDAYFRLGYQLDDLDWRLSIGTLNDDGFRSVNDSRQSNKLNFRLDFLTNNQQSWTIQFGTSQSKMGLGEVDNPTSIIRNMDATNNYININWEQVRSSSSTNVRLTYTEQKVVDNFVTVPFLLEDAIPVTTVINFDRTSSRTDLEVAQTDEIGNNLRLVYGASLRKDLVKSIFLTNDNNFHEIDTSRLFTGMEWRFGSDLEWILDFGISLEDSSFTETAYSPRLSVLRKINQNHMLRFVASRAKRNPVLYEHEGLSVFTGNIVPGTTFDQLDPALPAIPIPNLDVVTAKGNPDILPEDLISYEIGLRSQFFKHSVTSDIKIFSYELTDYINDIKFSGTPTDSSTGQAIPVFTALGFEVDGQTVINEDRVIQVDGIELSFNISPLSNLEIKSGFSFVNAESPISRIEESFPDSTAFMLSKYDWLRGHSLSASLYYIEKMEWLSESDTSPSIHKLDLRYAYMLDEVNETRIELIAQNLLEEYSDYFKENINERIYLLRISGGF